MNLYEKYQKEFTSQQLFSMTLIKRLLIYMRPYAFWVIFSIVLLFMARLIDIVLPILIGQLVNRLGAFPIDIPHEVMFLGGLIVASYGFEMFSMVIKNWFGQKMILQMRTELFNHIQHLPIPFFDRHAVGRLITRTIHDIDQINLMFTESLIPLIGSILLFIGMAIGMLWIDWRIAVAFACIFPCVAWLMYHFQYYQHRCYGLIRNVVSSMNATVQEYLTGASTVRSYGLQKREKKRFDEINRDYCEANVESVHHFSFLIAGIDLLQSSAMIVAFVVLALSAANFQAGIFFTATLYIMMFFRPLIDLADRYNTLQSAMAASERVFDIFDEFEEPEGKGCKLTSIECISFKNVWFAYEADHWILKDVSFEVRPGETVAFVGVTGAGKSTIISLLLRFYDYQRGEIAINGKEIKEYSLKDLRKQFSLVLQDPVIFSGTLLDNITLYNPAIELGIVDQTVEFLNLQSLVNRMPDGLNSVLTERGESLSVGERQLVSLARAMVQKRSLLVLDEATANIDTATERVIQEALKRVLATQTALVIAHRLSTIKDVQKIIVLDEGTIAESGSHDELISKKGLYEKLYRLQLSQ